MQTLNLFDALSPSGPTAAQKVINLPEEFIKPAVTVRSSKSLLFDAFIESQKLHFAPYKPHLSSLKLESLKSAKTTIFIG